MKILGKIGSKTYLGWLVAGKAPYTSCLRGRVFAPQGFLKLVFEKGTGVIIGVHILGTDACELIHCETSFLLLC